MSKVCDINESGEVLVTYITTEKGLQTVRFVHHSATPSF